MGQRELSIRSSDEPLKCLLHSELSPFEFGKNLLKHLLIH